LTFLGGTEKCRKGQVIYYDPFDQSPTWQPEEIPLGGLQKQPLPNQSLAWREAGLRSRVMIFRSETLCGRRDPAFSPDFPSPLSDSLDNALKRSTQKAIS
jgi:hypothetical protein